MVWCSGMRTRPIIRLTALTTLLVFVWTLTLSPAFAALGMGGRLSTVPPPPTAAPAIVQAAEKPAEPHTCSCLKCGLNKKCCCQPEQDTTRSATTPSGDGCALRAVCDTQTEAVQLPFSWWVALLPAPTTLAAPVLAALYGNPSVSVVGATSYRTTPRPAPPRSLS